MKYTLAGMYVWRFSPLPERQKENKWTDRWYFWTHTTFEMLNAISQDNQVNNPQVALMTLKLRAHVSLATL